MTGQHDDRSRDVGSLGEEAAKLINALDEWARARPGEQTPVDGPPAPSRARTAEGLGALADRLAAKVSQVGHELDEHVATDAVECRYCPVCRLVHAVRQTSPEVRDHLAAAAGSLLEAASGLLATQVPADEPSDGPGRRAGGVERIDLDDETGVDPTAEGEQR